MSKHEISEKVKHRIIKEYLSTPKGRAKLASSMWGPLDTKIGYYGLWRRVLEKDVLFGEHRVCEVPFWMDPEDFGTFYSSQDLVKARLITFADESLLEKLRAPDEAWDVRKIEGPETFKKVLDDYEEVVQQEGHLLMNARAYAEFRPFLERVGEGEDTDLRIFAKNQRDLGGVLGRMKILVSRCVDPWEVFFVPKVGRYSDTLRVEVLEEPSKDDHPQFKATLKLCMEVDPSKVKTVRFEYPEKETL